MATDIDDVEGDCILKAVCQYINENHPEFPEIWIKNIVDSGIQDDCIVVLVDCGIKGTPKFIIPADKLEFMPKPEVKFPVAHSGDKIRSPKLAPDVKRPTNGRRKRSKK